MTPWNEGWTEEDTEDFAREQNRLNVERMAERFRVAANIADRIIRFRKIIEEACKRNPNGLPF
jgi:hypothetical protein